MRCDASSLVLRQLFVTRRNELQKKVFPLTVIKHFITPDHKFQRRKINKPGCWKSLVPAFFPRETTENQTQRSESSKY